LRRAPHLACASCRRYPPVASDAAFTLSALPSCVALLATTGAPAPVTTDAGCDDTIAARDLEPVSAAVVPVDDVVDVVDVAPIDIAVAVSPAAPVVDAAVDAASATQECSTPMHRSTAHVRRREHLAITAGFVP